MVFIFKLLTMWLNGQNIFMWKDTKAQIGRIELKLGEEIHSLCLTVGGKKEKNVKGNLEEVLVLL